MSETKNEYAAGQISLQETILRLRSRASMLRTQAYIGIFLIITLVVTLIVGFINLQKGFSDVMKPVEKAREPYDYRLMESRHDAISEKLSELNETVLATKQELVYEQYANAGKQRKVVLESLFERSEEIKKLKVEIEDRLSKDRQNMRLEIAKIKDERDFAVREGSERFLFLQLIGNVAFRIGVLVLAMYLIAIISNISKYLLRVADHLNSTADSIDLLRSSGFSIERGISALTPHQIDFHIDESPSIKSIKEAMKFFKTDSKDLQ